MRAALTVVCGWAYRKAQPKAGSHAAGPSTTGGDGPAAAVWPGEGEALGRLLEVIRALSHEGLFPKEDIQVEGVAETEGAETGGAEEDVLQWLPRIHGVVRVTGHRTWLQGATRYRVIEATLSAGAGYGRRLWDVEVHDRWDGEAQTRTRLVVKAAPTRPGGDACSR